MADLEKTIRILLYGDDQVGKTIIGVEKNLDALGSRVQAISQPFADLADNALKVETALAGLAAGGLVLAFKASSDFENATIELKKVIGDQADQLDIAKDKAFELSNVYGESAESILNSTANYVQAGFDVKDAMELTRASMDLVIAGNVEAGQASEILISILKGFKAPASEAYTATDILNEVSNKYATNIEQLGVGMARLSPVASNMGFTMQETAGILTPVIEIFRSGDEAANALKTGLLRLVDDNPTIVAALKSIGVSQTDSNGALRSGKDILTDVATAFQHVDENQKAFVTQQLVGINQAPKMVEVFNNLAYSSEITAVAMNSAGSAAKEVAARLESAEVSVNRFKTAFVNLGIAVGDEFRKAGQGAIDGGTEIENALRQLIKDGTFDPIFSEIRSFAEKLGVDLRAIAVAMPEALELINWTPLIDSVKGLGSELSGLFKAFFGDIDLTTPEGLATAIQKIINGATALTNVVNGILDAWKPFISVLSAGIDKFTESDEGIQELVGQFLGWSQVINTISSKFDLFTAALGSIGLGMNVLAVTRIPSIISSFTSLSGAIGVGGALSTGLLGPVTLLGTALAYLLALQPNSALGKWARENIPYFKEFAESVDKILLLFGGFDLAAVEAAEAQAKHTQALGDARVELARFLEQMGELPSQKSTAVSVEGTESSTQKIADYEKYIKELPDDFGITINTDFQLAAIQDDWAAINDEISENTILLKPEVDQNKLTDAKNKIDELPSEKLIAIEMQGEIDKEIARIKTSAETLQSSFEWKAKVDIAEIEAFQAISTQVSQSFSDMFTNTGDVISDLVGGLSELSSSEYLDVTRYISNEERRRDELLQVQKDLAAVQIEYAAQRTEALKSGRGLITIDGQNLEPELQLVLTRIIELTQVQANEQGLEFLIGF